MHQGALAIESNLELASPDFTLFSLCYVQSVLFQVLTHYVGTVTVCTSYISLIHASNFLKITEMLEYIKG